MLDLFSGDGGCAVGYAQAGFNVVGVDIHRKRHYPYEFHQAGALGWLEHFLAFGEWPAGGPFDAIHASPPCQAP
jgi:DNA (cytosine-5)-methyltransferase 1